MVCATFGQLLGAQNSIEEKGALVLRSLPHSCFEAQGWIGGRAQASIHNWLLPAPAANPGMLEMFRARELKPQPNLVPWAGEFAGKYLQSSVETLRVSPNRPLQDHIRSFVEELIATQAENGYLGPFPRVEQLKGHWDLWGHYHVLQGLLDWHEMTRDGHSLAASRRAADLICVTYLEGSRRIIDAGSEEMNMAILHAMARLYRLTGNARYCHLVREIEKDWERAGDYLRTGLARVEFFRTPRPRWESLHDLQGIVELWRITGDEKYRRAFEQHWRSIARWDIRNTGGFSGGEQATGNAWSPMPIETCCTVAWMALTIDYLRLTGDSTAVDFIETAFVNAALGAQHPSGRWWTYNTPMDGVREASAHTIVFQARAGTPELNCCSVNGPRTLGMLADWAVMDDDLGIVVNWHGAAKVAARGCNLECDSGYPLAPQKATWKITRAPETPLRLRFRIPAWVRGVAKATLNGEPMPAPGPWLTLERVWIAGDRLDFDFAPKIRVVPGDREALGKVSLSFGPVLLACDQADNDVENTEISPLDLNRLQKATIIGAGANSLVIELPTTSAKPLRLRDFAQAGARGSRYHTWLPPISPPPPPAIGRTPRDGATVGNGPRRFTWTTKPGPLLKSYLLTVFEENNPSHSVIARNGLVAPRWELDAEARSRLDTGKVYAWRIATSGPGGDTESVEPHARFLFDPGADVVPDQEVPVREDGLVMEASLTNDALLQFGRLIKNTGAIATPQGLQTDGRGQMVVYALPEDFGDPCTVAISFRVDELPANRLGQLFSAWSRLSDDPLRLVIDNGKLFARVEAGSASSTAGAAVTIGRWHRAVAVRTEGRLTLWLDGQRIGDTQVAGASFTSAQDFALGGNPHFNGNECLAAAFRDLAVFARAHNDSDAQKLSSKLP